MVVVAVVAILAAIGFPAYLDQMQKTRRAEGKVMLMEIMNAQEKYYTVNNTYSTNLAAVGYSGTVQSENGFYTITAAACGSGISSCVTLTATAGTAQSSDGDLTLDSTGAKTPVEKW